MAHELKQSGFKLADLRKYNKATVAVLGFLASLVSQGVLHGEAAHLVSALLAAATAVGVWAVPNVGYTPPSDPPTSQP